MTMSVRAVTLATVLLFSLSACQSTTGTSSPTVAGPGLATSSAPASIEPGPTTEPSAAALAGTTDTAWGRIWDSLPPGFPAYPGATPAGEAATGPASAVLAVQGADAKTIAGWLQSKLEQATYSTEALSGPLEDGSYVLESTGTAPGCRVQVSIAPLGGLTTVTVLYGESCPKP